MKEKRARFNINISDIARKSIEKVIRENDNYSTISEYCSKAVLEKLSVDLNNIHPELEGIRRYKNAPITQEAIILYLFKNPFRHTVREISNGLGYEYNKSRISNMYITLSKLTKKGLLTKEEEFAFVEGKTKSKFNPEVHTLQFLNRLYEKYGSNQKAGESIGVSKNVFRRWLIPEWRSNHPVKLKRKVMYYTIPYGTENVIKAKEKIFKDRNITKTNGRSTRITKQDKINIDSFVTDELRPRRDIINNSMELLDLTKHQIIKHIDNMIRNGVFEKFHTLLDGRTILIRRKIEK